MTDDAGVVEQAADIVVVVVGDDPEVEAVERGPEVLPLAQDRDPGEAGLEAFETDLLEEAHVVDDGTAPLVVVVLVVVRR